VAATRNRSQKDAEKKWITTTNKEEQRKVDWLVHAAVHFMDNFFLSQSFWSFSRPAHFPPGASQPAHCFHLAITAPSILHVCMMTKKNSTQQTNTTTSKCNNKKLNLLWRPIQLHTITHTRPAPHAYIHTYCYDKREASTLDYHTRAVTAFILIQSSRKTITLLSTTRQPQETDDPFFCKSAFCPAAESLSSPSLTPFPDHINRRNLLRVRDILAATT